MITTGCATTKQPRGSNSDSGAGNQIRPVYHGSVKKEFRLIHTRLNLIPDWQNRYLHGTAGITVTPFGGLTDRLVLDA